MLRSLRVLSIATVAGGVAPLLFHMYLFQPRLTLEQAISRLLGLASISGGPGSFAELAKFWLIPALIVFIGTVGLMLRPRTPNVSHRSTHSG